MHVSTHTDKLQQLLQREEDNKQRSTAAQAAVCFSWGTTNGVAAAGAQQLVRTLYKYQFTRCIAWSACLATIKLYSDCTVSLRWPSSNEYLLAYRPVLRMVPAKTLHSPHPLGQLQQAAPWCDTAKHHMLLATSASTQLGHSPSLQG